MFRGIAQSDLWTEIDPVQEGFSGDEKFHVSGPGGECLLRISPADKRERRLREYTAMRALAPLSVNIPRALDFGDCEGGVYTLLSWVARARAAGGRPPGRRDPPGAAHRARAPCARLGRGLRPQDGAQGRILPRLPPAPPRARRVCGLRAGQRGAALRPALHLPARRLFRGQHGPGRRLPPRGHRL